MKKLLTINQRVTQLLPVPKYVMIALLCFGFAVSASAKLGETVPQLIKRFGKSYTVEPVQIGKKYKFRSENVSVDVLVASSVSVGETYFSDHPLTANGEPPNNIVQGVLRTNVPKAKWLEVEAASYRADYAMRSSDNGYIALLRYTGPQPEDAIWTMTVARREDLSCATQAIASNSAAPSHPPQETAGAMRENSKLDEHGREPATEWYPAQFLINDTLAPLTVEIAPDDTTPVDAFYDEPPAKRPSDVAPTCVLVRVVKMIKINLDKGYPEPIYVFMGWWWLQRDMVDVLHGKQEQPAKEGWVQI
jgi:hypothetical protein